MASPTYQRRSSRLNKSSSLDESADPIPTPSLVRKSRLQSKSSPSPTRYSSQGRQTSPKQEWISENDLSDSNPSDDEGHTTEENIVVKATHTPEINVFKRSPKAPSPITKESATPSRGQPQTKSSSLISPVLLMCALVVALGLGLFLFAGRSKSQNPHASSLPDQQEELLEMKLAKEIKTMQRLFPLQSNETWADFYAAFLGIMEEEPPQPSVLLLIGPNSSEGIETVQCIAERMARITNHIFGSRRTSSVTIHVEERQKKAEALKKELDDRLHLVLQGSYAVVLERLEQIPPKAAMVLHGFCDNFAAPFKKKIIILTAAFNQDDQPVNSRQVDRQLRVMWDGELGADKSASLVSRVANSPLFIEPESGPSTRCNLT